MPRARSARRRGSTIPRPIATATDLAAYRVIQEALTNVCKHAGPAMVAVRLRYRPGALDVTVENDAGSGGVPAAPPAGTGHGIVGMHERIGVLGGTLRTGPRPGGGYRVAATLPLPAGTGS